ncbi:hypothetical protein DFR67_103266 [Williamsia limnetica]|uniref:Condensation domain-containing protein n=1 Tax=Williamsia limnetica TaxID=882452 RepID=A0A318RR10_WILLI|nr:hypothetical protein [Williamsia limnetica]PYE19354.1 hypothetical protein DFR67_103266 [Williamsia limnetica]
MSSAAGVSRLGVADDIFWRTHHGMGIPIAMQGLWRFDATLTAADLELPHRTLAAGPLTRRVVRRRVWPARNHFAAGAALTPVYVEPEPLAPGTITQWADGRGDIDLDITHGPVWELSLAHLETGGSVVSLLCSHVVADAESLIRAAAMAVDESGATMPALALPTFGDDARDAVSQLRIAVGGVARSVWRGVRDPAHRAELFAAARRPASPQVPKPRGFDLWREPTAIFSIDSGTWNAAARRHGGTPNTLFTALIGELVLQIRGSGPAQLAVPVSYGGEGANTLTAASIDVASIDECRDLPLLRDRARAAFTDAGAGRGMGPPAGMPEEALGVIGNRAAHALVPDPGSRDGLASNMGDLDGLLTMLSGHRGRAIAARSVHPHLTAAKSAETRCSVSGWAATAGGDVTICIGIPDPTVAHDADLRELINKVLGHWDLTADHW